MRVYQMPFGFITTNEKIDAPFWEITDEQSQMIDECALIEIVDGEIIITKE